MLRKPGFAGVAEGAGSRLASVTKYAPPDWLNPARAGWADELAAILYLHVRKYAGVK
jgi:hypothetical protein